MNSYMGGVSRGQVEDQDVINPPGGRWDTLASLGSGPMPLTFTPVVGSHLVFYIVSSFQSV